ncbi:hypothetical protein [Lelliottia amnigena]
MTNLVLPKFISPDDFKNIFKMEIYDCMTHFNISEELAGNFLNTLCFSMMENTTAIEREGMLKRVLRGDEWQNYLKDGVFSYDGVTYNEEVEII